MVVPRKYIFVGVGVLFLILGFGWSMVRRHERALDKARIELAVARGDTRSALLRADSLAAIADSAERRADSLVSVAEAAKKRAVQAESDAAIYRERYRVAALAAPDTCAPALAAADSALAATQSVAEQYRQGLAAAIGASLELQKALDSTQVALSTVEASARRLEAKAAELERASRPSLFSRLLPRPGVGVAAGVDRNGKPAAVAGITLSWTL